MTRNEAKKLIRDLVHDRFAKYGECECERGKYELALTLLGIEPRVFGKDDEAVDNDVVVVIDLS